MTNEEALKIVQEAQKKKEESILVLNDYLLPFLLTYLGFKKSNLNQIEKKALIIFGVSNIIINKDKYFKLLGSLFTTVKK